MEKKIITGDTVLRDASGNPLNPKDRAVVPDMSAAAIDRRESIEKMTEGAAKHRAKLWAEAESEMEVNFGAEPQLLSETFPLHNIILCEVPVQKEQSASGIYIPKKNDIINDAIAVRVIKVGPETVNVKPGDRVFQGSPQRPMFYPIIDDTKEDEEVLKWYLCFAENWLAMDIRKGAKSEDFVPSPHK